MPNKMVISILCAGPGLGFYIPGVIMHRQLVNKGLDARVHVFENFLQQDKKNNVPKAKIKFHRNFPFALMGQNLAKDPSPYLDEALLEELLRTWKREDRRHFVIFSGFWIPVMEKYARRVDPSGLNIHLCHVDAANSTSWNLFNTDSPIYTHVWFNHWQEKRISYHIDIAGTDPVPFNQRENEFLIHGGGWGMGTYKEKIAELNSLGLHLSIISYEKQDLEKLDLEKLDLEKLDLEKHDLEKKDSLNQYYMLDPAWNTWDLDDKGEHQFPPLGKVLLPDASEAALNADAQEPSPNLNAGMVYTSNNDYPEVYNIIRMKKGIISKPGAGTLMDSLSSATPLLFLEPFGDYENKNALLWEYFGLGISLTDWIAADCAEEILLRLHENLLKVRSATENYITSYCKKFNHGIQDLSKIR
jgi:hypothetical protein